MNNHLMLAVVGLVLTVVALPLMDGLLQYLTAGAGLVLLAVACFKLLRQQPETTGRADSHPA